VLAVAREARDSRRRLAIVYAGSAAEPGPRTVHPHQVVRYRAWWYVVAWCERVAAFRNFRADRILEATLLADRFDPRADFRPVNGSARLLHADEVIVARVAFDPAVARWIRERHPDGRDLPDGRFAVIYRVADPAWFVREVLQYGAAAEVLEPESLREAVRRMVSDRADPG
jgi:predicted DNA-binding transcriptional regulator YafY